MIRAQQQFRYVHYSYMHEYDHAMRRWHLGGIVLLWSALHVEWCGSRLTASKVTSNPAMLTPIAAHEASVGALPCHATHGFLRRRREAAKKPNVQSSGIDAVSALPFANAGTILPSRMAPRTSQSTGDLRTSCPSPAGVLVTTASRLAHHIFFMTHVVLTSCSQFVHDEPLSCGRLTHAMLSSCPWPLFIYAPACPFLCRIITCILLTQLTISDMLRKREINACSSREE